MRATLTHRCCLRCAVLAWRLRRRSPARSSIGPPASRRPAPPSALYKLGPGRARADRPGEVATRRASSRIDQTSAGSAPDPHRVRRRHLQPHAAAGTAHHRALRSRSTTLRKQPGGAKVAKHMILFEPGGGQVAVNETYLFKNDGKTAWNDPDGGTLKFFLPAGAEQGGRERHRARRHADRRAGEQDGEAGRAARSISRSSRARRASMLTYTVPYTAGADLAGKVVSKDENTYLIAPNGVTHEGRRPERSGRGAAHAGAHLRAARRDVQGAADGRGGGRTGRGGRRAGGGRVRAADRADHAAGQQ